MKNVQTMLKDIDKAIMKWDERSMFKLKKVGNLSRADLDTLELYGNYYNGSDFPGLMKPMGQIKQVLDAYGICAETCWN